MFCIETEILALYLSVTASVEILVSASIGQFTRITRKPNSSLSSSSQEMKICPTFSQ